MHAQPRSPAGPPRLRAGFRKDDDFSKEAIRIVTKELLRKSKEAKSAVASRKTSKNLGVDEEDLVKTVSQTSSGLCKVALWA